MKNAIALRVRRLARSEAVDIASPDGPESDSDLRDLPTASILVERTGSQSALLFAVPEVRMIARALRRFHVGGDGIDDTGSSSSSSDSDSSECNSLQSQGVSPTTTSVAALTHASSLAVKKFVITRSAEELDDLRVLSCIIRPPSRAASLSIVRAMLPRFYQEGIPSELMGHLESRSSLTAFGVVAPILVRGHDVVVSLSAIPEGPAFDLINDRYDVGAGAHRFASLDKADALLSFLLPLVLHTNSQPVLDSGVGPTALVLCPTRSLCDEAAALIANFASRTHLVIHNTLRGAPLLPEHRRADIVVTTPAHLPEWCAVGGTGCPHYTLRSISFVAVVGVASIVEHGMGDALRAVFAGPVVASDASHLADDAQRAFLLSGEGPAEMALAQQLLRRSGAAPAVYWPVIVVAETSRKHRQQPPTSAAGQEKRKRDDAAPSCVSLLLLNTVSCGTLCSSLVREVYEGCVVAADAEPANGRRVRGLTIRVAVLPNDATSAVGWSCDAVAAFLQDTLIGDKESVSGALPSWTRNCAVALELVASAQDVDCYRRLTQALDGRLFGGRAIRCLPLATPLAGGGDGCPVWATLKDGDATFAVERTEAPLHSCTKSISDVLCSDLYWSAAGGSHRQLATVVLSGVASCAAAMRAPLHEVTGAVALTESASLLGASTIAAAASTAALTIEAELLRQCTAFGTILGYTLVERELSVADNSNATAGALDMHGCEMWVTFAAISSAVECKTCLGQGQLRLYGAEVLVRMAAPLCW